VKIGMNAKNKVQRENRLLPFDDQCTVLEKVQLLKTFHFLLSRTVGQLFKTGFPHITILWALLACS
jgi:hypothetical protein